MEMLKTWKESHKQQEETAQERAMWVAITIATGVGVELLKPIGTHIMTSYALDARRGTTEFSVLPASSCSGLILPCYFPILLFWNEMFIQCYCILEIRIF
jgi:hypothetical protein